MYTDEELQELITKMAKLARTIDPVNSFSAFTISELIAERENNNTPIEPLFSMTDEQLLEEIKEYDWAHRWDPFYG